MKRSGEWDPEFGRVPTGRELPERSGDADAPAVELPRRSPDVATDNAVFTPPFVGVARRQGHRPRRHRRVRQRDRAVPQPVAVPPREGRQRQAGDRRRVQGPHPARLPRAARRRQGVRGARAAGRVRLLPRQRRRRRPRRLDRRDRAPPRRPASTTRARRSPRSSASPTSSARSSRTSSTTPRSTSSRWAPPVSEADGPAVRRQRVPGVPAAARPRRRDGRGAGRVLAPPHPRGVGLRRRGRADHRRPVPPAVPRRALLVGLPGVPGPRGQRARSPSCSAPTASASRCREETGWQYQPEQTTSAIICHHPQAKYFVAR